MNNLNNIEIRQAVANKRLRFYEVAEAMGISRYTLSTWLSKELSEEKKAQVLSAIEQIKI